MATSAHDVGDVHGVSSIYIKTCCKVRLYIYIYNIHIYIYIYIYV